MSDLPRIPAKTAALVCQKFKLEKDAQSLLTDQQTPGEFLKLLLEKPLFKDACTFLAYALPRREAIWWALQVAKDFDAQPPPDVRAALAGIEKWVLQPAEEPRRPTKELADKAGLDTPAGNAALAVFFSGGSIAPPEIKEVPPPEHMTALSVANAVTLAALLGEPSKTSERYTKVIGIGIDVAKGTNRWKEAAIAAGAPPAAAAPAGARVHRPPVRRRVL